jgi:hypothetical protein
LPGASAAAHIELDSVLVEADSVLGGCAMPVHNRCTNVGGPARVQFDDRAAFSLSQTDAFFDQNDLAALHCCGMVAVPFGSRAGTEAEMGDACVRRVVERGGVDVEGGKKEECAGEASRAGAK